MDFLLIALLFLQFGIFFYVEDPSVEGLEFSKVTFSIVLFFIATHLYRTVLTEIGYSFELAMLLPEIIVVVAMAIAYFQHVVAAFLFLLAGMIFLALTVVVINSYRLCRNEECDESSQGSCTGEIDV
jgi:hypothetical protein